MAAVELATREAPGKDSFAADRAAAATIIETAPDVVQRVKENRAFLGRAVRFAAEAGVRQFTDLLEDVSFFHGFRQSAISFQPSIAFTI